MEDIPMKECYKPTFEVMSQSQVVLEGEHLCPERKDAAGRDWKKV